MGDVTMSALVDRALLAAGLMPIAEARRAGDLARVRALAPVLETADLLAVGALADRIRANESGDVVRIFANAAADMGPDVIVVSLADGVKGGLAVLRRVAMARIVGPVAARVRIDWSESGLEVAQVALGFGASELVGPIANRRGLPIADASTLKVKGAGMVSVQALKKKELESLLAIAGRRAVFVGSKVEPVEEQPHV
jgi:2-iminoacetate synthase ThiH